MCLTAANSSGGSRRVPPYVGKKNNNEKTRKEEKEEGRASDIRKSILFQHVIKKPRLKLMSPIRKKINNTPPSKHVTISISSHVSHLVSQMGSLVFNAR